MYTDIVIHDTDIGIHGYRYRDTGIQILGHRDTDIGTQGYRYRDT